MMDIQRLGGAALALTTSLTAPLGVSTAAPTGPVQCAWRITAVHVLAETTGDTSPRAQQVRQALLDVGANKPGFVPKQCLEGTGGQGAGGQDAGAGSGSSGQDSQGAGDQDAQNRQSSGEQNSRGSGGQDSGGQSTGQGATAAAAFGWGQPDKVDDFEAGLEGWNLYDGPGHAGNGTRSPDAASVQNGLLTINGTGDGTTAGMAWGDGQKYGRWEGRMKAPKGSPSYNALLLLWPSEENFPVGGEIDFAEISDESRQKVDMFLHYGEDNSQKQGDVQVDATQWNNWALEWTPKGVTAFVNGKQWWHTDDTSILPPGPMHLCVQLDWFPKGDSETGQMQVDWVKQWSLNENAQSSTDAQPTEGTGSQSADSDSSTSHTDQGSGNDQGGAEGSGQGESGGGRSGDDS